MVIDSSSVKNQQAQTGQSEIHISIGTKIPITYNIPSGVFYIQPKHKTKVITELQEEIAEDLYFGIKYISNYKQIASSIAGKIVDKYTPTFFEPDGTLNLSKLNPEINKSVLPEDQDDLHQKILCKWQKSGRYDFITEMKNKIDQKIDLQKGEELFSQFMKRRIGARTVKEILAASPDESHQELLEREGYWGHHFLAYAAAVGAEERMSAVLYDGVMNLIFNDKENKHQLPVIHNTHRNAHF